MMITKKQLTLFVVLLLIFNVFLLYKVSIFNRKQDILLDNQKNMETKKLMTYDLSFRCMLLNNNIILDVFKQLERQKGINDVDTTKQDIKLVARFAQYHCKECVSYFLSKLKSVSQQIGEDKFIIMASYENPNSLNIIRQQFDIRNMETYNIESLNIEAEEYGYPYFFILSNNERISDVFVPEKAVPMLTNTYFSILIDKYGLSTSSEKGK